VELQGSRAGQLRLTQKRASGYIRASITQAIPSREKPMSSSTQPQAGSITADAPATVLEERGQGMASALIFGALLGSLYGALIGVCVAGMLHALQYLSFDEHGHPLAGSVPNLADFYVGGALRGAAIGAVCLMLLSGGLVLLLEWIQQLWRRR
jgi:hypothetical protein